MSFVLRSLCAVGVAASLANGQEASVGVDAAVLVQREVQTHGATANESLQRTGRHLTPESTRGMFTGMVAQLYKQLKDTEVELVEQRAAANAVNQYVRKVKATLGRRGTLFSDVAGLMPVGPMDDADKSLAIALLGLLTDKNFASTLVGSLNSAASEISTYRFRTAKKVKDLVVESATATDSKMSKLLKDFFGNQHHLLGSFTKTLEKSMRNSLAALPSNYSVTAKVANGLVDELVNHMNAVLDRNTEILVESNGGKFCGGIDLMLMDDLLPIANQTILSLNGSDAFAAANMPEASPGLAQLLEALSGISTGLTKVHSEAVSWIERVCGLVGAAAQV